MKTKTARLWTYVRDDRPSAANAGDGEGDAWWSEVGAEVSDVLAAGSLDEAAAIIAWWHHDWSSMGDTARAAAKRIRFAGGSFRPRG